MSKPIRVFLSDLDGTLTDGGCYVPCKWTPNSDYRRISCRDLTGFHLLSQAGIEIGVVTTAVYGSEGFLKMMHPKIHIFVNTEDKRKVVEEAFISNGYSWDEIAFIGDDINDISLLEAVGLPACPVDAAEDVLVAVGSYTDGYVCEKKGGYGAVREFSDLIRDMYDIPATWSGWWA